MSNSESQSELSSSMVALMIVISVGVALALVAKYRFDRASHAVEFKRDRAYAQEELAEVSARHSEHSEQVRIGEARASAQLKEKQFYAEQGVVQQQSRAELSARRSLLTEELARLKSEFTARIDECSLKARAAAVGQKFESLTCRNGRTYSEVTIVRVTDEGLEIRHTNGSSRIAAQDLDEQMQHRFQWAVARP